MAKIEDLIAQISDERLRKGIAAEVKALKKTKKFGLVFEEHLPETVRLPKLPVKPGDVVALKRELGNQHWKVKSIRKRIAVCDPAVEGHPSPADTNKEFRVSDLVVVRSFGEPIYPALVPIDRIERGGPDKPWHVLINADNFHALQLLLYCYEGKVDVIYIDPPYNTGARDWKYNNDYVDKNDSFRHSKWLSMMKKRLKLAKRLLKPNGILIVAIDENENHHLGLLLEDLFAEATRQMVTICVNPSGVSGRGLSRVDEQALFCFMGNSQPAKTLDDMLTSNKEKVVRWESLLRGGNAWYRKSRKNLCYPVLVDSKENRIIGTGQPFEGEDESRRPKTVNGSPVAWPVRLDGRLGIWRVDATKLMSLVKDGFAYLSSRSDERDTWTIRYLMGGTIRSIKTGLIKIVGRGERGEAILETDLVKRTLAKTIWSRGRHTAGGAGGTHMLVNFLGERNLFPFPKSLYNIHDCLSIAVGERRNGIVLDFFAGSGTTFHATALLNWRDGGRRQSISVTNNEVTEDRERRLLQQGHTPGEAAYERYGIADSVAWPRCKAVVQGRRSDDATPEGAYLETNAQGEELRLSEGFAENIEYFHLEFLDPDEVARGDAFQAVVPILWIMAGCRGKRADSKGSKAWFIPRRSPFAVLLKEKEFRGFHKKLAERKDIEWIFLVTDSDENFALMRRAMGRKFQCAQLYKSYLENFRLNTPEALGQAVSP